jgi:hypothetical protein
MVKRWLQKIKMKPGALRNQLNVSKGETIKKTTLDEIIKTPIGKVAHNPTETGKKRIHVTRLVKQRANLARNLMHSKHRRSR